MKSILRKLAIPALCVLVGVIVANVALSVHQVGIQAVLESKFAVVLSGVAGAIIAACISVYGVRAANQSSLERLAMQHSHDVKQAAAQREHDALQKTEDRKAAIRREVYTKGIETVYELLGALATLAETPLSSDLVTPAFHKFTAANSKIWLVAEPEAAHLTRDLTNQFFDLIHAALPAAYPLRAAMEPIWELDLKLEQARAEVRRIDTRVTEAKEKNEDIETRATLAESATRANQWVSTLKQERQRAMAALSPLQREYLPKRLILNTPVQKTIVRLVSSLRSELALTPDYEAFEAQREDQFQRVSAAISNSFGYITTAQ